MTKKKKWRFPKDRVKLHALLEKREQDLMDLQEEVEELRRVTMEADHAAINTVADEYNVTPEEFQAYIEAIRNQRTPSPDMEAIARSVAESASDPDDDDEKEDIADEDD